MHAIGLASGLYLAYLLLVLPAMAFRSARVLNAGADGPARRASPSRTTIYLNSIIALLLLFALTWFTARTFAYRVFALPSLGVRELFSGAGALVFQFAMMFVSHAVRTAAELRDLPVDRMMPQSPRERALYSLTSVVAGISEEAAYRGVLLTILWYALGSAWVAVFVSALAFALGHAVQGWKSMIVVFVMACSMHALVWYTGTLAIAMAVHALYDLLVPTLRRRIWPAPPTAPERIAG